MSAGLLSPSAEGPVGEEASPGPEVSDLIDLGGDGAMR
jgi:hypothetical protein